MTALPRASELDRLVNRLENYYDFECAGGPLRNCTEWQQLCALVRAARAGADALRPEPDLFAVLLEPEMPQTMEAAIQAAKNLVANEAHYREAYDALRASRGEARELTEVPLSAATLESLIKEAEREFMKRDDRRNRAGFIARYIYDSLHPEARVIDVNVPESKG